MRTFHWFALCVIYLASSMPTSLAAPAADQATLPAGPPVAKAVLEVDPSGANLLKLDAWGPWADGFSRDGDLFLCDNGKDSQAQRGASQTVRLEQTRPEPIVAVAWSKAEAVSGSPDSNYALYLDLTFTDGGHLWGQTAPFNTGTHDWERRRVVILPEKPIRDVSFHLLLRGHGGKALFRDPRLQVVRSPQGAALFDGVAVVCRDEPRDGFQIRDVAAGSDFVRIETQALQVELNSTPSHPPGAADGATIFDVTLTDTSGRDRALTLLYAAAVPAEGLRWLDDPRRATEVEPAREYVAAGRFHAGSNGRLSRYPLGAVADSSRGVALAIDMARPAFYRIAYNADSGELYLAYDLALTPERPTARLRFCRYTFAPEWGFRAVLARYYEIFPEAFRRRVDKQGLWMPFAKISEVEGWQDFGFVFKEGNNETEWDDGHDVITFRYTEPMTWWMRMPTEMPRSPQAALAEAQRLAQEKNDPQAKALLTSGFHDAQGQIPARLLDTPWCNGAVWSINSMPGIAGEVTDFKNKWNPATRLKLYGPQLSGDLDGEYIDSSEGYVTDELDFRRDHFAAADTPLVFSPDDFQPAIFRGLVAFEYARALAADVHAMDKLMMANSTPIRLPWLAPWLDVMGTETDWHPGDRWQPMSDAEMLYRRAICKSKPYCFLMNTRFEAFSYELVEKYMKRSLAYGMFPGFFSHNASQGHYFTRPELYNRDRPLFKKYVPLCRRVAEAGWEPITLARSSDERVYVERFGTRYLTVFNDGPQERTTTIELSGDAPTASRELLTGRAIRWDGGKTTLTLGGEDVAVIELSGD
jgi:hypothetical protein